MARADTKGERLLMSLKNSPNCELTNDGMNFVVQRYDPYHDKPIKPAGYPDSYNGHTVSRCIKKTATFNYKSGGAPDQTTPWDVHIFCTPLAAPLPMLNTISREGNQFSFNPAAAPSKPYGGVMAVAALNSGTDVNLPVGSAETTLLAQISPSDSDLSNAMRITAIGFEVIDTTAQLYRQGTLTSYRQNQPQFEASYWEGNSNEPAAAVGRSVDRFVGQQLKFPPTSTGNAMLMPNSKQWKVEEGAYVTIDFHSDEIPMEFPTYKTCVMNYDVDGAAYGIDETPIWFPAPFPTATGLDAPVPGTAGVGTYSNIAQRPTRLLPVNQSGIILSGLNPLATITLNVIYYVECAPSSEDQELLTLASQSPAYDAFAMMIISRLRRDSPVAVKLRENYMGEWFFNGIKDIINKVTPWLSNAMVVGKTVNKWIDKASTNDGYINPQSFVKGSVSKKVAQEKNPPKKVIPQAPGPAPMKRAFKPKPVKTQIRDPIVIRRRATTNLRNQGFSQRQIDRMRGAPPRRR